MNIGIVTTWFERGGAYVSLAYKKLLETQHDVYIYARGGEDYAINNLDWDSQRVTWGKKIDLPVPTPIDCQDFKIWIEKNNIEVIFFNEQHYWKPVLLCNDLNIICGAYIDYYTEETIPFFKNYDFLICNTQRHYSAFNWHPHCYYIPWGTDIKLFHPKSFEAVEENVVTFFHSSGYDPFRKGTDFVIKAFSQLRGNTKLIVHSQKSLKECFNEIKELIVKLESNGTLICIEKTISAPGLYCLGDIYVYPSRLDGIGLSMCESLASGLPIIVSNNPPMNEFVSTDNGKLIEITRLFTRIDAYYWPQCLVDCDHLAKLMQEYVNDNKNIPLYKQKAREYAEKHLNWLDRQEEILNIFSNAIKIPLIEKIDDYNKAKNYDLSRIGRLRYKLIEKHPFLYSYLKKLQYSMIRFLDIMIFERHNS